MCESVPDEYVAFNCNIILKGKIEHETGGSEIYFSLCYMLTTNNNTKNRLSTLSVFLGN